MSDDIKKSRRGVYYDLNLSPYEYKTPYGDIFKFSSQKKLDIYTRDIKTEIERFEKNLNRNYLSSLIPDEILSFLYRTVYKGLYKKIEG